MTPDEREAILKRIVDDCMTILMEGRMSWTILSRVIDGEVCIHQLPLWNLKPTFAPYANPPAVRPPTTYAPVQDSETDPTICQCGHPAGWHYKGHGACQECQCQQMKQALVYEHTEA